MEFNTNKTQKLIKEVFRILRTIGRKNIKFLVLKIMIDIQSFPIKVNTW